MRHTQTKHWSKSAPKKQTILIFFKKINYEQRKKANFKLLLYVI